MTKEPFIINPPDPTQKPLLYKPLTVTPTPHIHIHIHLHLLRRNSTTMSPPTNHPFLFPETQSTVLPNPTRFFSPHLLSTPLPTNSFFQNFVIKNGDQPEYIHPYLIKSSSSSSLSICYVPFSLIKLFFPLPDFQT